MAEDRSSWLQHIESGIVAESRTRSFLIDHFWVLERSVGTDGAERTAFLTADDVLSTLKEASDDNAGQIALPGTTVSREVQITRSPMQAIQPSKLPILAHHLRTF